MTAIASGRVQKAGYRGKVVTIARALELKGYVQNLPDGRVKVVAEGDQADLERLAKALMMKNSIIDVADVEKKFSPASGDFEGFAKMVEEGETDSRLDTGVELLKELIVLTRLSVSQQEKMLEKLDQSLDKLDQSLGKQDQSLDKQDQMLEKLDRVEVNLVQKLDEVEESVVGEIKALRSDIKPLLEDRLLRIESDVSMIKAKMGL